MKNKNWLILFLLIVICLSFVGCGEKEQRVDIIVSSWKLENLSINVGTNYEFIDFDKNYNDDGTLTVVINYEAKQTGGVR